MLHMPCTLLSTTHSGDGMRMPLSFHRPPMKFPFSPHNSSLKSRFSTLVKPLVGSSLSQNLSQDRRLDPEDSMCSSTQQQDAPQEHSASSSLEDTASVCFLRYPGGYLRGESRVERAWAHYTKLGRPKLIVAPMVDNSDLPFRMLCRKYGAEAAYTPMLHSRIFTETEKYRKEEFTTCKEDRPLFVQFCANDPDILLKAARMVEPYCDYVDINLGCPQRIASRGNYGAFLMDDLPLVKSLVEKLAQNLQVPVSCKIRVFPKLEDTINYARMLEEAGCSLLAVHGRTRYEKDGKKIRADWKAIKAVKSNVGIPVLANGNIRHMDDIQNCLEETGADGVLSAESLLENPALFAGFRTSEWIVGNEGVYKDGSLDQTDLLIEYLKLCERYPVHRKFVLAHVYKMLGEWFKIHPRVRDDFSARYGLSFEYLYNMVDQLRELGVRIPLYVKDTNRPV